jgi:ribonuclease VapC
VVIDTSAIVAILLGEPEAQRFSLTIAYAPRCLMSAFSVLETSIVIEAKKGEEGGRELDLFLHKGQVKIVNLDMEQSRLARHAWRKYGKGRHPAGLNIGDCCSYALAVHSGEPLLFKGEDFGKTDVKKAAVIELQATDKDRQDNIRLPE